MIKAELKHTIRSAPPMRIPKPPSEASRRLLDELIVPKRLAELPGLTGLSEERVWSVVKELRLAGYVERVARGVYRTTDQGFQRLRRSQRPAGHETGRVLRSHVPLPPEGEGWTPERLEWFKRFYAVLGPAESGRMLGIAREAAWMRARRTGLEYGDVDGHILLAELARLLGEDYGALYARARRVNVLRFPPGVRASQRKRKALVPLEWADQVAPAYSPPDPGDMPLQRVARLCGVGTTTVRRALARLKIRPHPHKPQHQQAAPHVTREEFELIREHLRTRPLPVRRGGLARTLELLAEAGLQGLTAQELGKRLGSEPLARLHLRKLRQATRLERFEIPGYRTVVVYRLANLQGPPPTREGYPGPDYAPVLAALEAAPEGLPVYRIAQAARLSKTTTRQRLSELVARGQVWRTPGGSGKADRYLLVRTLEEVG